MLTFERGRAKFGPNQAHVGISPIEAALPRAFDGVKSLVACFVLSSSTESDQAGLNLSLANRGKGVEIPPTKKRPPRKAASGVFIHFRQFAAEQYLTSLAYGVPALEQVPAGHADGPCWAHTPPEQLPLPFCRSAEAVVVRTTELKNTNDNATTKIFIPISSPRRSQRVRTRL